MDNVKDDRYYLQKMQKDLHFIIDHMTNVSEDMFEADEVLQDSMMFRLIQISESARKLTEEYRESHSQIPWNDVFGLRNRIVHDYGKVNMHVIYTTLVKDIPDLIRNLEE